MNELAHLPQGSVGVELVHATKARKVAEDHWVVSLEVNGQPIGEVDCLETGYNLTPFPPPLGGPGYGARWEYQDITELWDECHGAIVDERDDLADRDDIVDCEGFAQ